MASSFRWYKQRFRGASSNSIKNDLKSRNLLQIIHRGHLKRILSKKMDFDKNLSENIELKFTSFERYAKELNSCDILISPF